VCRVFDNLATSNWLKRLLAFGSWPLAKKQKNAEPYATLRWISETHANLGCVGMSRDNSFGILVNG